MLSERIEKGAHGIRILYATGDVIYGNGRSRTKREHSVLPLQPLLVHMLILLGYAFALDDLQNFLSHAGLTATGTIELFQELVDSDLSAAAVTMASVDHGANFGLCRQCILHRVRELFRLRQVRGGRKLRSRVVFRREFGKEGFANFLVTNFVQMRWRPRWP